MINQNCPDSSCICSYDVFNLATGLIQEMTVGQRRAVIYCFVRYAVIMSENKTTTERDTGIMLGLRKRRVFAAHSSVFSLLYLQGGRQTPATLTASCSSAGCRAGVSAEQWSLPGQGEHPHGTLHRPLLWVVWGEFKVCPAIQCSKLWLWGTVNNPVSDKKRRISRKRLYVFDPLPPWLHCLSSTPQEKRQYL